MNNEMELLDVFGDDLTIVNAARVSFAKESHELTTGDQKLIKYLADHNHVTPFFHPYRYQKNGIVVETPFLDGLKHYLRNTFLPMALMALLAFAFGWLSFWLKATSTVIEIIAISLPAFLFGISLWWIQQSRQNQARDYTERGQIRRLGEYGAFRWAISMLGRLAGVVIVLGANAAAIALTAGRAI
jgi:hypothetical protein